MIKYQAHSPSPRPFWAGLDPDEPEPLDKILAALHCHQVAPLFSHNTSFTFTVNREDHHRLADGFPELQKLAAAINKEIPFVSLPLVTPTPSYPEFL